MRQLSANSKEMLGGLKRYANVREDIFVAVVNRENLVRARKVCEIRNC